MKYSIIEFWIATAFFALMLYVGVQSGFSSYGDSVNRGQTGIAYFVGYLLPNLSMVVVTYGAFLLLNYYVLPDYLFQKKHSHAFTLTLLTLAITGTVFMIDQSYLRDWIYKNYGNGYSANMALFSRGFSMAFGYLLIYGIYVLVREAILYQYRQYLKNPSMSARIIREISLVLSIWLAILIPFWILRFTWFFTNFGPLYLFVLPFCFSVYFLNIFWLIPRYKQNTNPDLAKYILSILATGIVLGFIEVALLLQVSHHWSLMGYIILSWLPPFIISTIISWWVYLANEEKYKQIRFLKTALGASDANLQFLRSQINPHFLFNVLNTLYGTALSEKAEKTGEGIQKLGDMMRFMLHENTQDKILLTREMEYLHNYISLQNLRIAHSDNIAVNANITDKNNGFNIAPMLLIPFIENAYKHGISFQHQSWINISLQLNGNVLQLDVDNSLHAEKVNDPERQRSGIGLENVKQRLQLLYPNNHELVIRQNQSEFIIKLTLQLL
ncbi:sensor histidine kinase [Mucilaginibacter sp.]|uniref:sensor histidine kinase n=1 Tax=Mucilaginibacter sp. TaxID=1882438 RepID=UPI003D0A8311